MNSVIGIGKNWNLPGVWPVLLRYVSCPILMIILSLAYPAFEDVYDDPMHILGFIIGHFLLVWAVLGFIFPQWLDVFIIPERRDDWMQPTAPGVLRDTTEGIAADGMETGSNPTEKKLEGRRTDSDLRRDTMDGNTIDGSSSRDNRSDELDGQLRRDDLGNKPVGA